MGTATLNLTAHQGTALQAQVQLCTDDDLTTPLDLTIATLQSHLRTRRCRSELTEDLSAHWSVTDAPNGIIDLDVPEAVTALWSPGHYVYDLIVTTATYGPQVVMSGRVEVVQPVTRP